MKNRDRISQIKNWIFDLDGTLTLPVHDFDYIRSELNIPDAPDILHHLMSLPECEALPKYERLNQIEIELADNAVASEGMIETIEYLIESGSNIGILTRNDKRIALRTLEAIGADGMFAEECILGRDEAKPKPNPEGINILIEKWGVKPEESAMVGDYLYDLQAGRSAKVMAVQVGRADGKKWDDWYDIHLDTLSDLKMRLLKDK